MVTLSQTQERILNLAMGVAEDSDMQSRHGCIITRNSKVISTGTNSLRSYINGRQVLSCHAEIDALYRYVRQSRQCKLYG